MNKKKKKLVHNLLHGETFNPPILFMETASRQLTMYHPLEGLHIHHDDDSSEDEALAACSVAAQTSMTSSMAFIEER